MTVDPKHYENVCENPRFRVRVYPNKGSRWTMHVEEKRGGGMLIDGRYQSEHDARTAARDFLESAEIAPASMTLPELNNVLSGG